MHVDTLRFLDRFIGLPLCWAATLIRRLSRLAQPNRSLPQPHKVLVIKLSEMGSTVLAYPALAELKRRSPEAELFFIVFKKNAGIIEVLDLTPPCNIIMVDSRSASRLLISGFAGLWRLLREHIDTIIDMDFFSRFTTLFGFLLCRGNRVGFHRYTNEGIYRGNLLTHRVMYSPHVHTSVAFMALIKTLFEKPDDEPHYRGYIDPKDLILPKHAPSTYEVTSVWRKLEAAGIKDGGDQIIILINPNSSDVFPLRKWPLDYFAELCAKLLELLPLCWLVLREWPLSKRMPDT